MTFFVVFVLSFMSADYLITGSVTNTWIGIAIMTGVVPAAVRRLVDALIGIRARRVPEWDWTVYALGRCHGRGSVPY